MYKLRVIAKDSVRGITIPEEVAQFFDKCSFKVNVLKIGSKYGIFCESGCVFKPTEEEIAKYKYET